MVEVGSNPPITWGNVVIEWYKGAMNRVDPAATAFPHRDAEFQIVCIGGWDDEADDVIGTIWTRSVAEATGTGALNGAFLNFNSRRRLWTGHGTGEGRLRREPGAPARNQAALRPDEPLPGEQQHRAVGFTRRFAPSTQRVPGPLRQERVRKTSCSLSCATGEGLGVRAALPICHPCRKEW